MAAPPATAWPGCPGRDYCPPTVSARDGRPAQGCRSTRPKSDLRKAIEHCPTNTTARYQLANCLWKRGARHEAIEQLAKAIDMSGREDVEMMVELGYMWANVGQLDQAMEFAEQSIRIAPDYPLAWQLRGDVLRRQLDWTAALASYHRCLTYDPHNTEVQLSVAEVYYELDRPARVLATLHRLEDDLPLEHQPERMLVLKSLSVRTTGSIRRSRSGVGSRPAQPPSIPRQPWSNWPMRKCPPDSWRGRADDPGGPCRTPMTAEQTVPAAITGPHRAEQRVRARGHIRLR